VADKDTRYSYDVFYRVGDGYGEHIQVWADDEDTLLKGREGLVKALKAMGAGPLPRDMEFSQKNRPAETVQPVPGKNPNRLPQTGNAVTPVCPDDGAPMRQRFPDASKGQTWPWFWSCTNYPNCKGKRNQT
jgi:hypothetical protein